MGRIVGNILLGRIWVDWERWQVAAGLVSRGYPFSLEFTASPEGTVRSRVELVYSKRQAG